MSLEGKRACVIGAGFGGLALAIRLQAAGVATTLVEARDKPGGSARSWLQDGFTFDNGSAVTDPAALRELWQLTGHDMAADIELLPVDPSCRFTWPDGASFDLPASEAALRREIARLAPGDLGGYEAFLAWSDEFGREVAHADPVTGLVSMTHAAPALLRHRAWKSVHDTAGRFVENEKLRQVLSAPTMLSGGNPFTAEAGHALAHKAERDHGVWWPRGGNGRLAAALLRQFERIGGEARLGDPISAIHTNGVRVTGVETRGGWRGDFHAVASNADRVHTYRDLLSASPRGRQIARRLARKRFGASLFVVHFGIDGSWPGIPHFTMLFGLRYREFFDDVFEHGVLPADFPIHLHHANVTDPSMAPEGLSTFSAFVPVPHLGKLAVDWTRVGPMLEARVLAEIERRLIPDLSDRIVTRFHYTPRDFASEFNLHLGSPFGLEPTVAQAALRPRNRDAVLPNLHFVGAGVHPGAGLPGIAAGAARTAATLLESLAA